MKVKFFLKEIVYIWQVAYSPDSNENPFLFSLKIEN
jgi:hypothetical protein